MERLPEEIEWHFQRFMGLIQKRQTSRGDLSPLKTWYEARAEKGRVYWKIFIDEQEMPTGFGDARYAYSGKTRIFGFVRRKDGAIFRAATYKQPETRTKTAIRGYVFDDSPSEYFNDHGIVYAEGS